MTSSLVGLAAAAVLLGGIACANAGQLHVEPLLLEMNAPSLAGSLMLRNDQDSEVNVQVRVMRWSQVGAEEKLEPTTDVVASPPSAKLAPGDDYLVRIVRMSKAPLRGEESYRVIVDQLPDIRRRHTRAINLLIRHSIPVFFRGPVLSSAHVEWSLRHDGNKLVVAAANGGDERLRIASLRLRDSAGSTISFGNGLVGYILGRSSTNWIAPNNPRGFGTSGPVSVSAETDKGPINAMAQPVGRH